MTPHDFTALAAAQAGAEDALACVLAAREEAVGEAADQGVHLAEIARGLGITPASVRATRERATACSPASPGVEPDLDPGDSEFMWDDEEECYVDNTITIGDLRTQLAADYSIDDATLDDLVEDVVDPRVWEITISEATAITHAAWEAVRDPTCGRAELRALRAWRFHNGLDRTPPRELVVAAAEAGAYVHDIAEAAHTTSEAVREATREAHRENTATTSDEHATRAREGILRRLADGEVRTAGSVRTALRHGPTRDAFDDVLVALVAEGVVMAETTTRGSREVTLLRLADTPRGDEK